MTDEEIDRRLSELADLKIPPREQEENRYLLARGDRLYEEATGDNRNWVDHCLREFEAVLDGQDPEKIREARERLKEQLDNIELDMEE